ncbi:MAG: type II toxin-antitoxin system RelE/ParE family toxin [Bacteroidales bacterium]|nr:type II toxin-antitoxin system RelE/ParE family toxin [Bacteroidales bacterium]
MAKYEISDKALSDLQSIWNYTIDKWSERQADIYYNCLINEFSKIANSTDPTDREYVSIQQKLYGRRCKKHIIFYKISDGIVKIIRVLHQQMDIESKF